MAGWVTRARDVVSRLPLHQQGLAALGGTAAISRTSGDRIEDAWKRESLAQLVADLESFADPDPRKGTFADVEQRLAYARTVRKRTIEDYADRWDARDPIDRERSPNARLTAGGGSRRSSASCRSDGTRLRSSGSSRT